MSTSSQRSWKGVRSSGISDKGSGGSCTSNEKNFDSDDAVTVMEMITMLSCPDQSAQRILLAMTGSLESCQALRRAGCIPMLIQMLHPINVPPEGHPTQETKLRAAQTLKNVVQFNCDEKMKRKEQKVLKQLESLRTYIDYLKTNTAAGCNGNAAAADEKHPLSSSTALMKLSFDEDHRNSMCLLGAIHTLAELLQMDHAVHGINDDVDCVTMRRYTGMTLTNLTVGDKRNKILLGTMKDFMHALVAQLDSPSEDVCQVTASVLRNLSWHASSALKTSLVESDAVKKLTITAINTTKESTLKASLSALWNLSAHSHANKIAICHTAGAIEFLVRKLNSNTQTIVENAGGILTNITTIVTTTDEAIRKEFLDCEILEILLNLLTYPSFLVVGNACGMLWHLSSFEENQDKLLELGAVRKLNALTTSKHERIKHGACSTLRNILSRSKELEAASTSTPSPIANPVINQQQQEQQQPMDLRTTGIQSESTLKPQELQFSNEPLDLSIHSSKSTPIHTVSENEFGPRIKTVPFLNPPLHSKTTTNYDSPKNFNSCPEFMRFIQPAHKSSPIDFSRPETNVEDATINYSLHFPEPDDPVALKNEDTVKTYYCEGTPLNFSTSNSMTDLTQVEKSTKLKPIIETETGEDHPRKYCTESTPATFSRASSLSSIASNVQGGENKAEYLEETPPKVQVAINLKDKGKRNVTFSATDTPLMFSRTSSVNSLDSVEINYEDAGSVVSEFSVRASEVVSPSELPDSPREIAPSNQMSFNRSEILIISETKKEGDEEQEDTVKVFATTGESQAVSGNHSVRSLSPLTIDDSNSEVLQTNTLPESNLSVVDIRNGTAEADEMKVFGVEDTPWRGVSNATSLSDLVCEMETVEAENQTQENIEQQQQSMPERPASPPPPPLPPKPKTNKPSEPVNVDSEEKARSEKVTEKPVPSPRLPKSKSELSKLDTKAIKMSTSYHENLKRENQLDPELAALIMKGKSRVRGNKSSAPKNPPPMGKKAAQSSPTPAEFQQTEKVSGVPSIKPETLPILQKLKADSNLHQSTTSTSSEWNEDTLSISVPSLSINAAFQLVQSKSSKDDKHEKVDVQPKDDMTNSIFLHSTISKVEAPTEFSSLVSSTGCRKSKLTESNLMNQKPPSDMMDLDSSMISVASLRTEIASIAPLEEGMKDLSIGGETYTIGGGGCGEGTDAEDSFFDDTESLGEIRISSANEEQQNRDLTPPMTDERFRTFTSKKHLSPKQKRREDPGRYLTRTIISPHTPSPRDRNGNHSASPPYFSTFKVERSPRIVKPSISATSNESTPDSSPKGIRGRKKTLYSSLPPQKKSGPPIPPKPKNGNNGLVVRTTRTSELRAASSRDSSPKQSKNSSKNSSTNSLNNPSASAPVVASYHNQRKTPPKPPVRTTASATKNFAVVRSVRNSNSSIGFSNEQQVQRPSEPVYSTLPRSLKASSETNGNKETTKVGKLSSFWNQLMTKTSNSKDGGASKTHNDLNSGKGYNEPEKKKFGFNFGRKKKNGSNHGMNWISNPENNVPNNAIITSPPDHHPMQFDKGAIVKYNEREITSTDEAQNNFIATKMTPV